MSFMRSELKYYLNEIQAEGLKLQLSHIMEKDKHCGNQPHYKVRSLYFDSENDECLYEKQSGLLKRRKIRLRTYDSGNSVYKFEIKRKEGHLVKKDSAEISIEDAMDICKGRYNLLLNKDNAVLDEIYATFSSKNYRPKTIVEYNRVPFVLPYSNIRVTFDECLRTNISHLDLFSSIRGCMPVILEKKTILEVKFDRFLPLHLRKVLSNVCSERMAISKYTLARRFQKSRKWEDN